MLHYSSGKPVSGYEAMLPDVTHVHKVCIDWYVNFASLIRFTVN